MLVAALLAVAMFKRTDVYEAFVEGARDALPLMLKILPYMAAMLCGISALRATGAMGALVELMAPAFEAIGVDKELVPLMLIRPFSGNAAMALLQDVFATYGTDTYIGMAASLMLGSTETVFYTVGLYLGSVGVKKSRFLIPVALLSGAVGVAAAIAATHIMGY